MSDQCKLRTETARHSGHTLRIPPYTSYVPYHPNTNALQKMRDSFHFLYNSTNLKQVPYLLLLDPFDSINHVVSLDFEDARLHSAAQFLENFERVVGIPDGLRVARGRRRPSAGSRGGHGGIVSLFVYRRYELAPTGESLLVLAIDCCRGGGNERESSSSCYCKLAMCQCRRLGLDVYCSCSCWETNLNLSTEQSGRRCLCFRLCNCF